MLSVKGVWTVLKAIPKWIIKRVWEILGLTIKVAREATVWVTLKAWRVMRQGSQWLIRWIRNRSPQTPVLRE